jgi:hypothetical protein
MLDEVREPLLAHVIARAADADDGDDGDGLGALVLLGLGNLKSRMRKEKGFILISPGLGRSKLPPEVVAQVAAPKRAASKSGRGRWALGVMGGDDTPRPETSSPEWGNSECFLASLLGEAEYSECPHS